MCRHAYFPRGTDVGDPLIEGLLEYLDDAAGGHGLGVGTWRDDKAFIAKSDKMTPKEAFKAMEGRSDVGWLFHTRLASIGAKVPDLCQPFNHKDYMVTHNGHWSDWKEPYWALLLTKKITMRDLMNDSRTMAVMVGEVGPLVTWEGSGVFLSWKKGEDARVDLVSGDFEYSSLPAPKGGMVYASCFPKEWPMRVFEFSNKTSALMQGKGPKVVMGDAPRVRYTVKYGRRGRATPDSGRGGWDGMGV